MIGNVGATLRSDGQALVVCPLCGEVSAQTRCSADGTATVAVPDPPFFHFNRLLGERYRPLQKLGEGGFGVVYLAYDIRMRGLVATKLLRATANDVARQRFEREARYLTTIRSLHIVNVFDLGSTPTGEPFLVMEYLEGASLAEALAGGGASSTQRAVEIAIEVLLALEVAHGHDPPVIHRDLKPGNIFLCEDASGKQHVKLIDFGIAWQTPAAGISQGIVGTPIYMSPEQCGGTKLDPRSDLYSVGVVLYECLTGDPPFRCETEETELSMLMKHVNQAPPPLQLGVTSEALVLEGIVMRALAKDPDDRWAKASEMRGALEAWRVAARRSAGPDLAEIIGAQTVDRTPHDAGASIEPASPARDGRRGVSLDEVTGGRRRVGQGLLGLIVVGFITWLAIAWPTSPSPVTSSTPAPSILASPVPAPPSPGQASAGDGLPAPDRATTTPGAAAARFGAEMALPAAASLTEDPVQPGAARAETRA